MEYLSHLLIDAHNVIHQWPETRRELRRDKAIAREMLAAAVRVIHDHDRYRVTLVFDGRGQEITVERPGGQLTFSFLFSPSSMSADDVIERMVGAAPEPALYTVVTQDLAERRTIEALGGRVISPSDLADWVKRSERAVERGLTLRQRQVEKEWNEGRKKLR
jgi:uncharacterized protein